VTCSELRLILKSVLWDQGFIEIAAMAERRGPDHEDHLPPIIDYLEDCMKSGKSWCLDAAVLKIRLVIKKPNRSKVKNLAAIWLRQLLERTPVARRLMQQNGFCAR
jgi:hypothetical protein